MRRNWAEKREVISCMVPFRKDTNKTLFDEF
jgi:hypothetical protein